MDKRAKAGNCDIKQSSYGNREHWKENYVILVCKVVSAVYRGKSLFILRKKKVI
jgi:hypothetical protein